MPVASLFGVLRFPVVQFKPANAFFIGQTVPGVILVKCLAGHQGAATETHQRAAVSFCDGHVGCPLLSPLQWVGVTCFTGPLSSGPIGSVLQPFPPKGGGMAVTLITEMFALCPPAESIQILLQHCSGLCKSRKPVPCMV